MLDKLSNQLNQPRRHSSHGHVLLGLTFIFLLSGWFVYHGVVERAQADAVMVSSGIYTSPRIDFNLTQDEYISKFTNFAPVQNVPPGTSVDYTFTLYNASGSTLQSNLTAGTLLSLHNYDSVTLRAAKSFSFQATLTAVSPTTVPVVDRVDLAYETTTTPVAFTGTIAPLYGSNVLSPGGTAYYTINIVAADGRVDSNANIQLTMGSSDWPTSLLSGNVTINPTSVGFPGTAQVTITTAAGFALEGNATYNFSVKATNPSGEEILLGSTLTVQGTPPPDPTYTPNLNLGFVTGAEYGGVNGTPKNTLPVTFYLHKQTDGSMKFSATPTLTYSTTAQKYQSSRMTVAATLLESGAVYNAYIKSPKFISKKSLGAVTATPQTAPNQTLTVDLDFGTIKAGDVNDASGTGSGVIDIGGGKKSDDTVNNFDWQILLGEFLTTLTGPIADFNNDGHVTAFDLFPFADPAAGGGTWQLFGDLKNDGRI